MLHLEADTQPAQALNPTTQHGRSFQRTRINPAAGGLKGFDAQLRRPATQRSRVEPASQVLPDAGWLAGTRVAADEALERLPMREVESPLPRHEKLPADCGLSLVKCHRHSSHGRHLGRPQTRRATANDRELGVRRQKVSGLKHGGRAWPKVWGSRCAGEPALLKTNQPSPVAPSHGPQHAATAPRRDQKSDWFFWPAKRRCGHESARPSHQRHAPQPP